MDKSHVCPNCQNQFTGKYCNQCGEKVLDQEERTIKYFLISIVNAFTFLEGKFFNSIKLIVRRPGELSMKYTMGIRQPYMRPVALFFLANFIYFLLPIFDSFNTNFHSQLNFQFYSGFVQDIVKSKIASQDLDITSFGEKYDRLSPSFAKSMIIFAVLLYSFVLALVNWRAKPFYSDHLAASFEFMTFTLIISNVLFSIVLWMAAQILTVVSPKLLWVFSKELYLILPGSIIFIFYFLIGLERNFYLQSWKRSAGKALIGFAGFALVLFAYRFILFLVTFWNV